MFALICTDGGMKGWNYIHTITYTHTPINTPRYQAVVKQWNMVAIAIVQYTIGRMARSFAPSLIVSLFVCLFRTEYIGL